MRMIAWGQFALALFSRPAPLRPTALLNTSITTNCLFRPVLARLLENPLRHLRQDARKTPWTCFKSPVFQRPLNRKFRIGLRARAHVDGPIRNIGIYIFDILAPTRADGTASRWVTAERQVRRLGTIVRSPMNNFPMKSPYLTIADQALEIMRKFMIEFGLTPSSRSRIRMPEDRGAKDEFDTFLESG
jgi:hypothetical protein